MARKVTKAEQARMDAEARQAAWDARSPEEKLALRIQTTQWTVDHATTSITALMDNTIDNLKRRAEDLKRYRDDFAEGKSAFSRPLDYANWFIGQAAQVNAGIELGTIAGQMAVLAQAEAELKNLRAQLAALTPETATGAEGEPAEGAEATESEAVAA